MADSAPGAGSFGRLVDSSDAAVSGAAVELRDSTGQRVAGPVATAADGRFELPFEGGQPPEAGVLVITAPDQSETPTAMTILEGARVEVLVAMGPHGDASMAPLIEPPAAAPRGVGVALPLAADLTAFGFRAGETVYLAAAAGHVAVWLKTATTPVRQAAGVQLPDHAGGALGYAPRGRLAGQTIRVSLVRRDELTP